jgi:hypothetical protein
MNKDHPWQQRKHKTGIGQITDHVISKITEQGISVSVSYSDRSRSRYLEIDGAKKIIIRISDHPASAITRWRYRYDIYTRRVRPGALNYLQFDEVIKTLKGEQIDNKTDN